jgi:O-antigen/teichoic acid export membrane protein
VTFITFLIVFFFNQTITNLFENQEISNWLYFLPISIFLVGLYQMYNYLLIREKNFKRLSKNKIIVSTTNASTQLGYGFALSNGFGLLFGAIVGKVVSIYFIIKSKVVNKYFDFRGSPIKKVAIEHQNFPKYDVPSAFFNKVSQELPSLTIPIFFSTNILGFYALMYRVLMSPLILISASIEDVFKQSATREYHQKGNCKNIFTSTFKKLVVIALIPFLILIIFAPVLFSFIFGKQWVISGEIAQIMAVVFFLRFVAKPLSYTFYIANKQKINMLGQFILIVFTLFSLAVGYLKNDVFCFFYSLSITFSIFYIVYLALAYNYSKGSF